MYMKGLSPNYKGKWKVPWIDNPGVFSNEGVTWRGARKVLVQGYDAAEVSRMVMWLQAPVKELAHLAVDSGGDPAYIHRALDPTMLPVPDIHEVKNKCQVTRTPYGRRFANKLQDINSYLVFSFVLIVAQGPSVGLNASLCRYDLFQGHLFLASGIGRLGILRTNPSDIVSPKSSIKTGKNNGQPGDSAGSKRKHVQEAEETPQPKNTILDGSLIGSESKYGGLMTKSSSSVFSTIALLVVYDDGDIERLQLNGNLLMRQPQDYEQVETPFHIVNNFY
uniref:Uncharacterized protein n=1 Tax=Oryza brachyantha TaxID=4533 RepID=J3NCT3_ORYBR